MFTYIGVEKIFAALISWPPRPPPSALLCNLVELAGGEASDLQLVRRCHLQRQLLDALGIRL